MLDGYPRTVGQAQALDKMLAKQGRKLDAVVYFDVTEETAVERLCGRLTCAEVRRGLSCQVHAAERAGVCDKCGAELNQRADDKPETIRERLQRVCAADRSAD